MSSCPCDACQKWNPLLRRVMDKLDGADLELFKEWRDLCDNRWLDYCVAEARLAGEWPGCGLAKEAARYRWLRARFYAIDFNYGDEHESVLAFRAPPTRLGPTNALDEAIDAAIVTDAAHPSPESSQPHSGDAWVDSASVMKQEP